MASSRKSQYSAKSSAPGSEAALVKWLLQTKRRLFEKKVLLQAAKLPGTSGFFKKINFLLKVLPQAAELPGTSGFFPKTRFLRKKVLPQAAKLPGTSGFL